MRIEHLRIKGLGPFREEHTFYFDPDCTVISGGNESGKTCIATAIVGALYGLPKESHFIGDGGGGRVALSFTVDTRCFRLQRDFRDSRVILAETTESTEEILFDGLVTKPRRRDEYRTQLALVLGTNEEAVWKGPGFVEDGKLPGRIDQVVNSWLDGSPQGKHEAVLTDLKIRLADLEGGAGGQGEIDELESELQNKQEIQEDWQETAEDLSDLFERFEEARTRQEETERAADEAEETLQNLIRFDELTRERTRLENNLSDLKEDRDRLRRHIEDEEQATGRLEDEFSDFLDATGDIEEGIQQWLDGANRHRSVTRDLDRQNVAISELPDKKTGRNGLLASFGMGLLAFLACQGAGAATLGFYLFPLFSIAGFGIVWYMDRNHDQLSMTLNQERMRLEQELEEIEASIEEAKRSLGVLGTYESPAYLRRKFRGFIDAQDKLDRARGFTAGARSLSEVVEAYEQVFSELQVLDTETRDLVARAGHLSGVDASPELMMEKTAESRRAHQEAAEEARQAAREREDLERDLTKLQARVLHPGHLAEDIQLLEKSIRDRRREAAELTVAVSAMTRSIRVYQEGHMDRVAGKASSYFKDLSRGRYSDLRLSEDSQVEVLQGDRWVSSKGLGRGGYGQLLLALRLAVREEMDPDRSHPMILDEAFLGWDDDRLEQARDGIEAMTRAGHQAIVLSGDPRVLPWAKNVIRLGTDGDSDKGLKAA